MNAAIRKAADRLDHRLQSSGQAMFSGGTDVRTLVDAVRRWDRLAAEGLTEDDKETIRVINQSFSPVFGELIERLQAQLADLRARQEVLLSDYIPDKVRMAQVMEEVARECANATKCTWCDTAVRRRFGLPDVKLDSERRERPD